MNCIGRIAVMLPFRDRGEAFRTYNRSIFSEDADILMLQHGERAKETPVDAAITIYEELKMIAKAGKDGFAALVVGCYLDPGVREAREIVNIPVYGVAETSLYVCRMLGQRIGVITTSIYAKRGIEANLRYWGMDKDTFVGCVNMEVETALRSGDELAECIVDEIEKLKKKHDVSVVTFGSGALYKVLDKVYELMHACECNVPVVDSNRAVFAMTKTLTALGLRPSRVTYPRLGSYEEIIE